VGHADSIFPTPSPLTTGCSRTLVGRWRVKIGKIWRKLEIVIALLIICIYRYSKRLRAEIKTSDDRDRTDDLRAMKSQLLFLPSQNACKLRIYERKFYLK